MLVLTILIIENVLLIGLLLIWLNRHCRQCQRIKCIERIFNQLCQDCKDKNLKVSRTKKKAS